MRHDQLFKDVLQAFFPEFLQLFFPDVAARVDLSSVAFLDKELFTDLPEGRQREADVVARVQTTSREQELILVHVEVQATPEPDFGARMWEYYSLLRLRHRVPVFPVALLLFPGRGGLTRIAYRELLFGRTILEFWYETVVLPDLSGADYAARGEPLAAALAALMARPAGSAAAFKMLCLTRVGMSGLDEARRFVLYLVIDSYLALDQNEQEEFADLMARTTTPEVREMRDVYQLIEQRGQEQGELSGKRNAVLLAARLLWSSPPPGLVAEIEAAADQAELDALLARVIQSS